MGEFEKLCHLKGYREGYNVMLQMMAFIEFISPKYVPADKINELRRAARDQEYDLSLRLAEKLYKKYFLPKNPKDPKSLRERFNNPFPPNTLEK